MRKNDNLIGYAGGFQPPLKEKGPLKNGLQRSILFSFQERTLNSFKLPTEFLGSEIIRKISGTSHFRTLTMSHLVLKLHLAFLKCHHVFHHMTGSDPSCMTCFTMYMMPSAKMTNVQNVQICTI